MRRGTTPTHTFTIPEDIDVSSMVAIFITYSQFSKTQLEKDISQITIDGQVLSVHLTQEETLAFKVDLSGRNTGVQIRSRDVAGEAYGTEEMRLVVEDVYKKGVI